MKQFLKPREGLRIVCPQTLKPLKAEGELKNLGRYRAYWQRRIADGDVEVVEAPKPTPKKSTKKRKPEIEGDSHVH